MWHRKGPVGFGSDRAKRGGIRGVLNSDPFEGMRNAGKVNIAKHDDTPVRPLITKGCIKKACDEWKLSLSIKGFEFTGDAFVGPKFPGDEAPASQLNLLDVLETLQSDQIEAQIVGREGDSFYVRLRIRAAA